MIGRLAICHRVLSAAAIGHATLGVEVFPFGS